LNKLYIEAISTIHKQKNMRRDEMVNIIFENTPNSSFVSGYLRMKSSILVSWYPNLKELNFNISKNMDDSYTTKGVLMFSDGVSETETIGETPVLSIDAFLDAVNPESNPLPPASKAISSPSVQL
jgi:hypothetical protein